jgi:hypothetical protein
VPESAKHRSPMKIITELKGLEKEILEGLDDLEGML